MVRTGPNYVSVFEGDVISIIYDARQRFRRARTPSEYVSILPRRRPTPIAIAKIRIEKHALALLRINKKINKEVASVLYTEYILVPRP